VAVRRIRRVDLDCLGAVQGALSERRTANDDKVDDRLVRGTIGRLGGGDVEKLQDAIRRLFAAS